MDGNATPGTRGRPQEQKAIFSRMEAQRFGKHKELTTGDGKLEDGAMHGRLSG